MLVEIAKDLALRRAQRLPFTAIAKLKFWYAGHGVIAE